MPPTDKNDKPIDVGMAVAYDRHPELKFKVIKGDFQNSTYGEGPDYIAESTGGFIRVQLTEEWAKHFTVLD